MQPVKGDLGTAIPSDVVTTLAKFTGALSTSSLLCNNRFSENPLLFAVGALGCLIAAGGDRQAFVVAAADRVLVLRVDADGSWEELFYGDFQAALSLASWSSRVSKHSIRVKALRSLGQRIQEAEVGTREQESFDTSNSRDPFPRQDAPTF